MENFTIARIYFLNAAEIYVIKYNKKYNKNYIIYLIL